MKLGHYVIVDDGGNYVTFHKLNVHIKIKKSIITPHNKKLSRLKNKHVQKMFTLHG